MSFQIKIDATALSCPSFAIPGIVDALERKINQTVTLEAGSFKIRTAGVDADLRFSVTPDGRVDYANEIDVHQGGFLSGRGSTTLVVLGFAITLDGTLLGTINYAIANIPGWLLSKYKHALYPEIGAEANGQQHQQQAPLA